MMHELNIEDPRALGALRHVARRSVECQWQCDSRRESREAFPDGPRRAAAEAAGKADAPGLHEASASLRPTHLLQSAKHALKAGLPEKTVLACLLHDIGVVGFIRCDHGYWGAQMIEPYVDEEISWAIQVAPGVAFLPGRVRSATPIPTSTSGCSARTTSRSPTSMKSTSAHAQHKWYMTSRMITVLRRLLVRPECRSGASANSRTSSAATGKQPKEGLGFDNSSSSHMWRTLNWPTRFLVDKHSIAGE